MFFFPYLIPFLFVESISVNICDENNGNPRIKVGLRFGKYTVLISSNEKVYRIENLRSHNSKLTHGEIIDLTNEWTRKPNPSIGSYPVEEVYAFPIAYTKNGSTTKRIVHIIKEKNEMIEQLFSYASLHSEDLRSIVTEDRNSLLIYKFRPEPADTQWHDPITLVNLFAKFPDDSIWDNLKTILSFPLNQPNLPNRFFVYYSEPFGRNEYLFKRHVMIGQKLGYGGDDEMDWSHDLRSGKCIKEDYKNFVVDAAFPITDYSSISSNVFSFDIIEFVSDHYFIRRVELTADRVEPKLDIQMVGSIGSIFGCKTSVPNEPEWYSRSQPKILKKKRRNGALLTLIWVCVVLLVILIITTTYMLVQLHERRQPSDHRFHS